MEKQLIINSSEAIQSRLANGKKPRFGPLLLIFARPFLLLLFQGVTFLLMKAIQVPNAEIAIRNWWTVYGTLVDVGCLGLLLYLTRREGIKIKDLIGFDKKKLKVDILLGLGIILVVFPITIFGFGRLAMFAAYGNMNPAFPAGTFTRTLPLLAVLYSRILWWPVWSATEELTYEGYALPRLFVMTKSTWLTVLTISFFYSIQHSFLSLAGFQYGFYMFLLFVPLTMALQFIYLKVRRLTPLIIGHWMMDLFSVLFMLQVG